MTFAPSWTNLVAMPCPNPLPPPVTIATLFSRRPGILRLQLRQYEGGVFKENGVGMAEDMGKGDANGVTRMVMAFTDWRHPAQLHFSVRGWVAVLF